MKHKLDILAIGAHPDDVELSCAGTLIKQIALGYKVGICDLTAGELGTRGSKTKRIEEANEAATIMGVTVRENLGFEDGFFQNDKVHQEALIQIIRKYKPRIVLTNAIHDRHPDHGRAAQLTYDAVFLSGLAKIETDLLGSPQAAFRPSALYNYIQSMNIEPDFVVDISQYFNQKLEAIKAYKSQFYDPNVGEENTFISSPEFLEFVKARNIHWGVPIGVKYAEGFTTTRLMGVKDLIHLI